jgi:Na+:H+ antiporter
MVALAFIMIHVGYEFKIDKAKWRQYGWDYIIAMTAAAFPWILVCLYFVDIMQPMPS